LLGKSDLATPRGIEDSAIKKLRDKKPEKQEKGMGDRHRTID
jgi:hypothetical protein